MRAELGQVADPPDVVPVAVPLVYVGRVAPGTFALSMALCYATIAKFVIDGFLSAFATLCTEKFFNRSSTCETIELRSIFEANMNSNEEMIELESSVETNMNSDKGNPTFKEMLSEIAGDIEDWIGNPEGQVTSGMRKRVCVLHCQLIVGVCSCLIFLPALGVILWMGFAWLSVSSAEIIFGIFASVFVLAAFFVFRNAMWVLFLCWYKKCSGERTDSDYSV